MKSDGSKPLSAISFKFDVKRWGEVAGRVVPHAVGEVGEAVSKWHFTITRDDGDPQGIRNFDMIIQAESSDLELLKEKLSARLEPERLNCGISFSEYELPESYMRSQGGAAGVENHLHFQRLDSQFATELARYHLGSEEDRSILAVKSASFLLAKLGLNESMQEQWIPKWLQALARKNEFPDLYSRRMEEARAVSETLTGPFPGEISSDLCGILDKYGQKYEATGQRLLENERNLPPGRSRPFVVFHSYIHLHFSRLGIGNERETLLLALIYLKLKTTSV